MIIRITASLVVISTLFFWMGSASASDVQKRLPGKYKLSYKGTFLSLEAVKYYHSDGTYESVGKARLLGIEKTMVHRGRWKFEKGNLVYTLTKSSTPNEAPVGVPLRFKVVNHDGNTLRYRDEKRNKSYHEKRIGDAK